MESRKNSHPFLPVFFLLTPSHSKVTSTFWHRSRVKYGWLICWDISKNNFISSIRKNTNRQTNWYLHTHARVHWTRGRKTLNCYILNMVPRSIKIHIPFASRKYNWLFLRMNRNIILFRVYASKCFRSMEIIWIFLIHHIHIWKIHLVLSPLSCFLSLNRI